MVSDRVSWFVWVFDRTDQWAVDYFYCIKTMRLGESRAAFRLVFEQWHSQKVWLEASPFSPFLPLPSFPSLPPLSLFLFPLVRSRPHIAAPTCCCRMLGCCQSQPVDLTAASSASCIRSTVVGPPSNLVDSGERLIFSSGPGRNLAAKRFLMQFKHYFNRERIENQFQN